MILVSVASTLYVALLVGLWLGRFIAAEEEQLQNGEPEERAVAGLDATDP